jgi:penicillin-binding protein 1C
MLKKRIKKTVLIAAAVIGVAMAALTVAAWFYPLPERLSAPGSRVIEFADGSPMRVFLSPDDKWRIPVTLDEVDPDFVEALIAYEDERFMYHPGVDPISICRAIIQNASSMKVESGASTITMQLARIMEPRPRTLKSKLIESFRAVQLEIHLSKDEILEAYLQFAPYGKNIEGIEAASLSYFGHRATDLDPYEIVYLLSVPQRPSSRYPDPDHASHMPTVTNRIVNRLVDVDVFEKQEAEQARLGLPPEDLRPFPKKCMHVSRIIAARTDQTRVRSTVDPQAQDMAESIMDNYKRQLADLDIWNASVFVLDVESSRVLAAVGSLDFWDKENDGQVAGFLAPRSPGSAMKPIIYAMAIDQSVVLPDYQVPDIPLRYRGYEPINYDRRYRGMVKLEDALSMSLNIPFIRLLDQVGIENFKSVLRAGGMTTISPDPDRYGLSMALGAMEARPAELANLYAMLARGGEFRSVVWWEGQDERPPQNLISPAACWLTRRALRRKDRPDFPNRELARKVPQDVFWKTGTSAFHRDAWAVGSANGVVAVSWVGDFHGTGNHSLVGSERAGPILFDILEAFEKTSKSGDPDPPPEDMIEVEICSWSGRLAGPHCPHTRSVLAPVRNLPKENCQYHVEYLIDRQTGFRLNPVCSRGRDTERKTFTVLPTQYRRWVDDRKLDAPAPPPLHPDCHEHFASEGPRISYPRPRSVFFIMPGIDPQRQEIKLEAVAGTDTGELHWFVDGTFIGSARSQERVWFTPTPGNHEISVTDNGGRSHSINIRIIRPG